MAEYERQHEQGALDFYTDSADLFWQAWKGRCDHLLETVSPWIHFGTKTHPNSLLTMTLDFLLAAPEGSLKETLKQRLADVMARAEDLKGVSLSTSSLESKIATYQSSFSQYVWVICLIRFNPT